MNYTIEDIKKELGEQEFDRLVKLGRENLSINYALMLGMYVDEKSKKDI